MRYLSVCSGMEAASVAWHPLGWQPVGFSEIEPFPCAILKHRFPHIPNYGSLTEYKQWPLEPGAIDLLVGGTPCQSFSVAGLRKGLDDPRGNLALVFLGLADKLKPRWIVWENVPGVLSSAGGRDFGSFLGALVELGYGFAYRVLDAQHFGVPQRRRRVFVVACLGDWRAPAEVLLESDCVRRDPKKGRAKGQGPAAGAEGGVGADHPEGCWWDGGQVSQTLDAVLQKGQTMPEKNRFPAVLQPVVIDRAAFNQGQNAQYEPHIAESEVMDSLVARGPHAVGQPIPYRKSKRACSTTDNETWVEADASNTLNNFDLGDTRTTHAVVEPFAWTQNQREEVRILGDKTGALALPGTHQSNYIAEHIAHCSDVAPTVTSSGPPYSRTGNERVEADALAVTFQPGNLRRDAGADPSTTTTTTLKASAGDQMPHIATAMAVRRLTPVECERLQGFPDNWSRISWKGKPEDQCPDGPRYKACGNSMAVPVMRWIGERIAAADAKHFPNA
jgi:DNA (cytosine-5)-methyltransferase 1